MRSFFCLPALCLIATFAALAAQSVLADGVGEAPLGAGHPAAKPRVIEPAPACALPLILTGARCTFLR